MTKELRLLGAKNIATQKYFVFLEHCERNQMKLINPLGKVLTVPAHIFEKPESIHTTDFSNYFTKEQLDAVEKTLKPTSARKVSTTRKKKVKKLGVKTGLGATWNAPNLIFYKFHIEPLDPKQSFRINLESGKVFEMLKEEFNNVFSDIILSVEYSREGAFSFDKIPDRAIKYLKDS
ncbi:MAG: hypothetical protein R3B45_15275 [Bdellovibrionota bacterium]